jgi:4'-phosphopantetheinyl transferase
MPTWPEAMSARQTAHRLEAREIHVWRARLDAPAPEVVASLQRAISVDEMERARKFYFERDRRRFIVCRGILRRLLGSYLGRPPEEIAFRYGANGKPALSEGDGDGQLFFNLAHSDDLALFAFTRAGEIGIDVERIREMPDWQSIADLSFSPEERERLRACLPTRRREEFFHAWTRQEAILKAAGTGLAFVVPRSGGSSRIPPKAETRNSPEFQILPLETEPGFAAALAVQLSGAIPDFS